ncbi:type II secretion system protein GspD [Trinickia caryophylli]|uniref:General secretion pathway protein D n=2 Tax=Trinickia caryophylli TaxID=28094 RepID=A0A1X7DPD1_TRICW|nr:type II secretion system protein GspD [Trinickia caryophylli]SMF19107.1 general secretion pathway protein D [Trinickia caryophylli]
MLAAWWAWAQPVHAQVKLAFTNAEITQVAKTIGAATGRTIVVDPRVKGEISLVSDNPVGRDNALKTLGAALRMRGFALVTDHDVMKIVPEADAKLQGVPTYVGNTPQARGDTVVTQVFRLKSASAANLMPALRTLITPNNAIAAYPGDNALIVTDYADNVRRIASIIAGLDKNETRNTAVIELQHESAVDLAPVVLKLLDPGALGNTDASLKVLVTADPRLNALLLKATDPSRIAEARALIAQLDAPTRVAGNMHVVHLEHADARDLARVLRGMLGQSSGLDSSNDKSKPQGFGDGKTTGAGGTGAIGGSSDSTGTAGVPPLPSGGLSGSGGASSGGYGATKTSEGGLIAEAKSDDMANGTGMIQPDPATNSLVITAPEPVYRSLRNVIDQLDVRRPQVYLEAMIVEMTATSAANLGVQWQGAIQSKGGNNAVYGGTNFNTSTSQGIVNLTAQGQTLSQSLSNAAATTLLNNGINIGLIHNFGKFFGLGALVQALSTINNATILSSPNLITLDNEEARIVVGANVPVETGSYATATATSSTGVTAFNTYTRQDVGIVLHVKPQITKGGVIKLLIYSEDSSVDPASTNNPGGVTIIKRSVQSTVLADDGEIIVLGGLIQDDYAEGNNKVPWLGDIPVIGSLFRAENKSRTKTNVMVFLRPVIIRDAEMTASVSEKRYGEIRQESERNTTDNRIVGDRDRPIVPPLQSGPAPSGWDRRERDERGGVGEDAQREGSAGSGEARHARTPSTDAAGTALSPRNGGVTP